MQFCLVLFPFENLYLGLFETFTEKEIKNNLEELAQGSDAQQSRPDFKIYLAMSF